MKRVVIKRPGGYGRLEFEETTDPIEKPGHVVVRVYAIGVNYADCIVRMGYYRSAKELHGYPITPGFEFSGIVDSVPEDSPYTVGQRVLGVNLFECYASKISVPEHQLIPLTEKLSFPQGATFPVAFLTAWYAAIKLGQARTGMSVLVHAAAGGVGLALAQILSSVGCNVVGVVGSSKKIPFALEAGCTSVIDRGEGSVWNKVKNSAPNGYDLIFDSVGLATLREGYRHLAPTGRLISFGFSSMLGSRNGVPNKIHLALDYLRSPKFNPVRMAEHNRSIMAFNLSFLFDRSDILREGIAFVTHLLQTKKIVPLPVTEYPFADVVRAQQNIESGATVGRLVLIVNN